LTSTDAIPPPTGPTPALLTPRACLEQLIPGLVILGVFALPSLVLRSVFPLAFIGMTKVGEMMAWVMLWRRVRRGERLLDPESLWRGDRPCAAKVFVARVDAIAWTLLWVVFVAIVALLGLHDRSRANDLLLGFLFVMADLTVLWNWHLYRKARRELVITESVRGTEAEFIARHFTEPAVEAPVVASEGTYAPSPVVTTPGDEAAVLHVGRR
jgi:hypothetical protein